MNIANVQISLPVPLTYVVEGEGNNFFVLDWWFCSTLHQPDFHFNPIFILKAKDLDWSRFQVENRIFFFVITTELSISKYTFFYKHSFFGGGQPQYSYDFSNLSLTLSLYSMRKIIESCTFITNLQDQLAQLILENIKILKQPFGGFPYHAIVRQHRTTMLRYK